jgi:hypothetical protein
MRRRRRDSGHRNKLYEDSSAWNAVIVIGVIVVVMIIVFCVVWYNIDLD